MEHEIERTYLQTSVARKWLSHPESSLHLVCLNNIKACTYRWSDWSEVSSVALSLDDDATELFLNRFFWVCSVDLNDLGNSGLEMTQHNDSKTIEIFERFFVPYYWFAGERDIISTLAKRDIILTRGGDLAVIRGGFD